ncbi:hypothetical protein OF83DRAFT_1179060 [Amylostereum chailletii]|nr:hypothetical protein OF83DRAFT_1179060 [Amylostereum chailletii]
MQKLQGELDKEIAELPRIYRELRIRRNACRPLLRLPVEIIVVIATLAGNGLKPPERSEWRHLMGLMKLSQVCRRIRAIVLDIAGMWAKHVITFPHWEARVEMFGRIRDNFLDLAVSSPGDSDSDSEGRKVPVEQTIHCGPQGFTRLHSEEQVPLALLTAYTTDGSFQASSIPSVCINDEGVPLANRFHTLVNIGKIALVTSMRITGFGEDGWSVVLETGGCGLCQATVVSLPPQTFYAAISPSGAIARCSSFFLHPLALTLRTCKLQISPNNAPVNEQREALQDTARNAAWLKVRYPDTAVAMNESHTSSAAFWTWPQHVDDLLEDMGLPVMRSGGNWLTWPFKVVDLDEIRGLKGKRDARHARRA